MLGEAWEGHTGLLVALIVPHYDAALGEILDRDECPVQERPVRFREDDIKAAFRHFDDDNSGDIDVSELREALKHLGVNADGSQARAVMQRYDGGSGTLKLPEFRRLVTELRQFKSGQ